MSQKKFKKGITLMVNKSTFLRERLKTMLRIRIFEEKTSLEYPSGYLKCPVHLYIGQEAVAAGICTYLETADYVTTNHRSHGHYIARGGDMLKLAAEMAGMESGCTGGIGGSQHIYAPESGIMGTSAIVGSGISIGTGIGLGIKMKKQNHVSAIFLGDGATEEGYFYESLNFASLKKLPVLYVCENNSLATQSRIESRRASGVDICKIAESLGVQSIRVDGNNVMDVAEAAETIIQKIRNESCPYLIEAVTYRWMGHVSPYEDYGVRYRTQHEIEEWKKKCPIKKLADYMTQSSIISNEEYDFICKLIKDEVDEIFEKIKKVEKSSAKVSAPSTPY
ncbi:MAG: thiamine pyrophosphate-dependent dehydrogenase E1 component subunit alpha [Nitrospirae bacterium]|nr:thiamine pyrophosphate-dependent dehydrogenase E1 component subunit alpha [Nitrospirota bacterium]